MLCWFWQKIKFAMWVPVRQFLFSVRRGNSFNLKWSFSNWNQFLACIAKTSNIIVSTEKQCISTHFSMMLLYMLFKETSLCPNWSSKRIKLLLADVCQSDKTTICDTLEFKKGILPETCDPTQFVTREIQPEQRWISLPVNESICSLVWSSCH